MHLEFLMSGSKKDITDALNKAAKDGTLSKATVDLILEQVDESKLAKGNDLSLTVYGEDTWGPDNETGQFALNMNIAYTARPDS